MENLKIPDWLPRQIVEEPGSHVAQGFWRGLADGSSIVPGTTLDEIAFNLRLVEDLERQFAQK